MASPNSAQFAAIQAITGNVEVAYRAMLRSRTSLSFLIDQGRATCSEVRSYNLMTKAIYNFQEASITALRAAGETSLPPKPPAPLYVAWKGIPGDQALAINCTQGVNGLGAADFFVDKSQVEWRQEQNGQKPADPSAAVDMSKVVGAGLGAVPVVLVIIGIAVVATAVTVAALTLLYADVAARQAETEQIKIQATAYDHQLTMRAQCFSTCLATNGTVADCTEACARLLTEFKPKGLSKVQIGIMATAGILVVGSAIGILLYQKYRREQGGVEGPEEVDGLEALRTVPSGRWLEADTDVIDADFVELSP